MPQCVTISFFRMERLTARLWAFAMMGPARLPMMRMHGLSFWKLCGSGIGEGFTPTAFPRVYAILCVWESEARARAQVETHRLFGMYRRRAREAWTVYLSPTSSRGEWSGVPPFDPTNARDAGPVAALTRATVRLPRALRFWRRVPNISAVIGADPNVAFKIGIGEVPLLHQVTFSIWPSEASMAAFARDTNGPHAKAIRAVRDEAWFAEELYARFNVTGATGTWGGQAPLADLELAT